MRQETNVALNFGDKGLYERWLYLVALWHATPELALGPTVGVRDITWNTSRDFRESSGGAGYKTTHRSWVLGLDLSARFR